MALTGGMQTTDWKGTVWRTRSEHMQRGGQPLCAHLEGIGLFGFPFVVEGTNTKESNLSILVSSKLD